MSHERQATRYYDRRWARGYQLISTFLAGELLLFETKVQVLGKCYAQDGGGTARPMVGDVALHNQLSTNRLSVIGQQARSSLVLCYSYQFQCDCSGMFQGILLC